MLAAVGQMAATGVDYIKIGFFAHRRARECMRALAARARTTRLIAVILADEPWTFDAASSREVPHQHLADLLDEAAASGFAGAMLDTGTKDGRTLRDWRDAAQLARFVDRARGAGLLTGLAGSLGERDVPPLLALAPDYLGFRGALCRRGARVSALDATAFSRIRTAMSRMPDPAPSPLVLSA